MSTGYMTDNQTASADVSVFCCASAKAHIRQSILSSEEAMKIVTERHELEELRTLLHKVRDRLDGLVWSVPFCQVA